jgi:hypothetical protein
VSGLSTGVESQLAQVVSVYEVQAGSGLVAGVAPGATTITVDDPSDFHEGGGQLWLVNGDGDVSSAVVAYASVDPTTGLLTLAAPWDAAYPTFAAGDYVWVAPAAVERRAEVALDGDTDQVVVTRVPWSTSSQIPIGVRPIEGGEWVRVGHTLEGYVLLDAEGEYPDTDPASIVITDPDTGEEIGVIGPDAAFDTITADEVISPSVPARNWVAKTLYVDPVTGSDDNDGTAFYPLVDTFERVVSTSPGWGTADSGHPWSILASDGAVDVGVAVAGAARMRVPAGGNAQDVARSSFAPLDVDLTCLCTSTLPAAGSDDALLCARMVGANDFLAGGINVSAAGACIPRVLKRSGGTWTVVATGTTIGTIVASPLTKVRQRVQVQTNPDGGTDVRVKAWFDGTAEPDDWNVTANDTTANLQNVNGVGVAYRSGGSVTSQESGNFYELGAASIDADGVIVPTDAGGVGPFASIARACTEFGNWNDADVRLVLAGEFDESVFINGLAGGGRVFITGGGTAIVYGVARLYGVSQYVELRDLTMQDTGDPGVSGTIELRTSRHVEVVNVKVQSNSARANNVFITEGSEARLEGCQLNGATTNCLQNIEGSVTYATDNKGGASQGYRCANAILFVNGTKPTGGNVTASAGQIFGTTASNDGGTPPPTSNKVTKTFKPNATRTWRPEWDWRTDNRDVYQGEYQGSGGLSRGCGFYGTKLNVAGKTADSGKIFVKRRSSGGASQDQAIFLCSHDLASQPSGAAGPSIKDGPTKLGTLAWGEGKWFTIPKAWVQSMLDGAGGRRGFMLYNSSASPYVICLPGGGDELAVKFTYH